MPDHTQEPSRKPAAPPTPDRRTDPRYQFTADAEIIESESGKRVAACVIDLSPCGCYVETNSLFPLGTITKVRITKGAQSVQAQAKVVYTQVGKGMGLFFTAVEPEQGQILKIWLAASLEASWLAANRRRSQRILVQVPVRVSGNDRLGAAFKEETHTVAISAHGALIVLSMPVNKGQKLVLANVRARAERECVVAYVGQRQGNHFQLGLSFVLPNPTFWHVAFPPSDWSPRHKDAKQT